jgi:glutathione S-transferase
MTVNDQLPAELVKDRREFFTHMDFTSFRARIPELYSQLRVHLALLERQLADGRRFLFGDQPGFADATAWAPIWMGHGFLGPSFGELSAPFARLQGWQQRMRTIGHGQRSELDRNRRSPLRVTRAPRRPRASMTPTRCSFAPDRGSS